MKCGVFILHLCMWFYLKQCRWWHVAQELSAVTLVCCLCFTTVHACATFFIHLFSWFHFVCACLFHCALHTVWTELRFTLVTTAVFTWEQNKTKKNLLVTESQRKLCAHVCQQPTSLASPGYMWQACLVVMSWLLSLHIYAHPACALLHNECLKHIAL